MNIKTPKSGAQAAQTHLCTAESYNRRTSIDDQELLDATNPWSEMLKRDPTLQKRVATRLGVSTATIDAIAQEQPAPLGIVPVGTPFATVATAANGQQRLVDEDLFADRVAFIYDGAVVVRNPYPDFNGIMQFGYPRAPWRALGPKQSKPKILHVCDSEVLAIKLLDAGEEQLGSRVVALRPTMLPLTTYVPCLLASEVHLWQDESTTDASARFVESLERTMRELVPAVFIRTL